MGFSLSKLRLGNRHPVESPNSEAIPPQAHNHDVPHTARRKPQRIGTTFRHDEPEASGSHSTESHLSTEGRETNTYVETESSHIPSSPQVRVKKNRQLSEASSKPRPQLSSLPSAINHPGTQVEVFRWEMSGEKRALRITCRDLCQGLPQLAAESPGIWTEFSEHVVVEPYELIFYNKTRIKQGKTAHLGSGNWQKHLLFLVDQLEKEGPKAWDRLEAIHKGLRKTITFDTVPLLYRPGAVVLQDQDGAWRAYVIERHEYRTSANIEVMLIHVRYLDFDKTGKSLVPHSTVFELAKFDSERPITSLELIPKQSFDGNTDLIENIKNRGAEYFKYGDTVQYCDYHGDEWPRPSPNAPLRVIIDYVTSSRHLEAPNILDKKERDSFCSICAGKSLGLNSYPEPNNHDAALCGLGEMHGAQHLHGFEADQFEPPYFFCPPGLWAFSLYDKTWRSVSPLDLSEVEKQEELFDNGLYMESTLKKHFMAITREYMENMLKRETSSEPWTQKIGGLNVLLCGSSGVGKTYTAECLSEKYRLPLYAMTCGDLGDEPESFDLRLRETFLRGINWGAIILLDEVGEYVYNRDRFTTKRNILTPILLRHLETSESLTVVTMTDTEYIDEAFMGHIHWRLHLPGFSFQDQQEFWLEAFSSIPMELINKRELHKFIDTELADFEGGKFVKMNARQITNVVRFATAIARGGELDSPVCGLCAENIRTSLRLAKGFEGYIQQESKDSYARKTDLMKLGASRTGGD